MRTRRRTRRKQEDKARYEKEKKEWRRTRRRTREAAVAAKAAAEAEAKATKEAAQKAVADKHKALELAAKLNGGDSSWFVKVLADAKQIEAMAAVRCRSQALAFYSQTGEWRR